MGQSYSLVDIEFNKLDRHEKHESFVMMDVALKELHKRNLKVDSFNPKDVYYEDGIYFYDKVSPINTALDSKDDVILDNIMELSNLAFCCYLPSYDLKNGLLNAKVVSEQFDKFGSIFSIEDRNYYRSVLVNSYNKHTLPDDVYYSDYILGVEKDNSTGGNSLVKATQAGKMYADMLDDNGFGKTFFFACMVSTMILAFIGIIIYFLK